MSVYEIFVDVHCHQAKLNNPNHESREPINSPLLAWITFGEALHLNHHNHPADPIFMKKPGQYDIAYLLGLWPLTKLGLCEFRNDHA
jgi:fatty-acid desaturase